MRRVTCFHLSLAAIAVVVAGCGGSDAPAPQEPAATTTPAPEPEPGEVAPTDLRTLLAGSARSAEDQARDAGRLPADVIEYLGISPGMSVIDVIAAGGYYTEVLSLAVGTTGKVTAHNPPRVLEMRDGANETAISARLADNRLPNVTRLNADVVAMGGMVNLAGTYDAGITALNFHDIYNSAGEEGAMGAMTIMYTILKPGGVFGVIDHEGADGNDNVALHRVMKADAIRVAEAAGFVVEGDSGILHVDGDDMSLGVFDEAVRGKTHRFLLKLRKPSS